MYRSETIRQFVTKTHLEMVNSKTIFYICIHELVLQFNMKQKRKIVKETNVVTTDQTKTR